MTPGAVDPLCDTHLQGWRLGVGRAEDAQGTPTQRHVSPSVLVYEDTIEFCRCGRLGVETVLALQGHLAHKKQRPPRTLQ